MNTRFYESHGRDAVAIGLVEWCNQSSGYPGWTVIYKKDYEKARKRKAKAKKDIP